jgi:hypothetical protein
VVCLDFNTPHSKDPRILQLSVRATMLRIIIIIINIIFLTSLLSI